MKHSLRRKLVAGALVAAGAFGIASAFAEAIIVAPTAPPAVRFEPAPPPRAGFVWEPGHWVWEGRYVWAPGRWEAERVGRRWVAGEWTPYRGQYRYVPGHWI